jgi:hypothetical protein
MVVALFAVASVLCILAGPAAGSAAAGELALSLPPEVLGTAGLGQGIECYGGSWAGEEGVKSFEFQWMREGQPIPEATRQAYTMTKADEGKFVWCDVIAEGRGSDHERVTAESWNSFEFGSIASEEVPKNTSPPEVSVSGGGAAELGKELTCSNGSWSGTPTKFTYQWLRDKERIGPATKQTYTVSEEDEGESLSCEVTASNGAGSAFALSKNSLEVKGRPPVSVKAPEVEGIAEVGQTLTCNEGSWSGTVPFTYKFQWLLNGNDIANATGDTLPVEAADEGKQVSCRVEATNSAGHAEAASSPVTIGVRPPESIAPPKVSVVGGGKAEVGKELACSQGEWTGSPTKYEYRWFRGNEELVGQTANRYKLIGEDPGHKLFCSVTAENGSGPSKAVTRESEAFVVPESGGEAPTAGKTKPRISEVSGGRVVGDTLECSAGEWNNNPTSFEYQWVRYASKLAASSEEDPVIIAGASESTYVIKQVDEGFVLTCRVTAANGFGSAHVESEAVKIQGREPSNTEAPSISSVSGTARVGETLTCLPGVWEGAPKPTFAYVWLRNGVEVGAKEYVYTVTSADRGHTLSCIVTATNDEGSSAQASAGLEVPGFAPEALEAPRITGNSQVAETLVCEEGKWSAAPAATVKYEWLIDGAAIAEGSRYTVAPADRGLQLVCSVTETNKYGHESADSQAALVPGLALKELEAPKVSGVAAVGQQLTCEHGMWEGAPPPSFTYQWFRGGVAIGSATTSDTYTVEAADQGHVLSCVVTASNVREKVQAESSNGILIPGTRQSSESPLSAQVPSGTPSSPLQTGLTATEVDHALTTQIARAVHAARISKVLKTGGYSFSFIAPGAGTLEVQGYEVVKKMVAKGARRVHRQVRVSVLGGIARYGAASQATVRLRLTGEGRRTLQHAHRLQLTVQAVFKVAGGVSVAWSGTVTLSH